MREKFLKVLEPENMTIEINPNFERWMAKQLFPDGTMPVSSSIKTLMQMAYEAGLMTPLVKEETVMESGWLIEKEICGRPLWLISNWEFGWTEDSTKAIRFSRRQDAEQIASMMETEDIRITEHQWSVAPETD